MKGGQTEFRSPRTPYGRGGTVGKLRATVRRGGEKGQASQNTDMGPPPRGNPPAWRERSKRKGGTLVEDTQKRKNDLEGKNKHNPG